MWKRGEIAPKEQFLLFSHYFIYIVLTSGVKLHIHLLNVVVQFTVFLTLSTLICRSTDISKCFSESLEIRDNESRLYNGNNIRDNSKQQSNKRSPFLSSEVNTKPDRTIKTQQNIKQKKKKQHTHTYTYTKKPRSEQLQQPTKNEKTLDVPFLKRPVIKGGLNLYLNKISTLGSNVFLFFIFF